MFLVVRAFNGIQFLLFHVEHEKKSPPWLFRWRVADESLPSAAREWRESACSTRIAVVQTHAPRRPVEVECRPEETAAWQAPVPVILACGTARFRLTAKEAINLASGTHHITGSVRAHGVARFSFSGPLALAAGESAEIAATADHPMLANVILSPEEFSMWDPRLEVACLAPVTGWHVPAVDDPALYQPPIPARPDLFAFASPL